MINLARIWITLYLTCKSETKCCYHFVLQLFLFVMNGICYVWTIIKLASADLNGEGREVQEKSPHLKSFVDKSLQEKTRQISPLEKTPQPVLQHVEKSPQFPTTGCKIYKCIKFEKCFC